MPIGHLCIEFIRQVVGHTQYALYMTRAFLFFFAHLVFCCCARLAQRERERERELNKREVTS